MRHLVLVPLVCAGLSWAAFATDPEKDISKDKDEVVSTQKRDQMALMHEKMAACLRSEKPLKECREEMHKSCTEAKGEGHCPMMERMHGMKGRRR